MPFIHLELFPEEYDFIKDSIEDFEGRDRGINPMNQEYINYTNQRRYDRNVKAYMPTHLSPLHHLNTFINDKFISSREYCDKLKIAERDL